MIGVPIDMFRWAAIPGLLLALRVHAALIDIHGPSGSGAFGTSVTVLPNGNFVVTDPNGPTSNIGAVYLYSPSGTLISTLTGSSTNDHVGNLGVTVVGGGHFVVISASWNNGAATQAGAVTWVNGTTGLSGVVSVSNSLVGTTANDKIGSNGVTVLSNGNYVVASQHWNNGIANGNFGAATWGNGSVGIVGAVSASNSLVGTTAYDWVGGNGGVTALSNGNYVIASGNWSNGAAAGAGAATWGDGISGTVGAVSASNSLVGTTANDYVSSNGVIALNNGNYVVASSNWNNHVGAATWGNGITGIVGPVSTSNSLAGATPNDGVSDVVTALSNGNYVVDSVSWNNAVGAATWGNGTTGTVGIVSASNSLVGTTANDVVGINGITALSNGNYVVASSSWNNNVGAATWGDGNIGTVGTVSASNSLVGSIANDSVGVSITALSNGNYVVASPFWNSGVTNNFVGAATWGNGSVGIVGAVSASNSLVGSVPNDQVGTDGVTALSDGNYVVESGVWNNGAATSAGAVTWGNGSSGIAGTVSSDNSLVGATANDQVGGGVTNAVVALSNGNYAVYSPYWNNGGANQAGAVTLTSGSFRLKGTIQQWNSVLGMVASGGSNIRYAYDPVRQRLIVGRPAENIVSLFTMDQIFAGDFDP
jgi:hypothetical protein